MESTIDYSNYSLDELIQARQTIDTDTYPARAAELDRLIAERQAIVATTTAETQAQELRRVGVRFHGNAKEFFSIWIVNLLLTLVTLGIYSAWAKVRTNRYFYGNTEIDGHRFAYLAEPLQILKGRIIAAIAFAAFAVLQMINPVFALILMLVFAAFTPLIVVLGLRFKMRMTAYRNVRFQFHGSYGDAFLVFVVWPFLSIFTFYLLMPWVLKKIDQYIIDNTSFGDRSFDTGIKTSEYYANSISASLLFVLVFIVGALVSAFVLAPLSAVEGFDLSVLGILASYLIGFAVASSFYQARIRNHLFGKTKIDSVARLSSQVETFGLVKLRVVNTLAIVFTLGLAIPWAKIRAAKFFADATQITVLSGINEVLAGDNGTVGATAEEAATLFDVDLAVG
ncbi:YjgN family protein [Alteromonas sp. ASW11-36]|uniref:YjgN family protein n=1 Tax=Alteromonas arenosi TaxID=3055817 RepID=A0ABT7T0R0_9ALTE|nr:YjgN family protein [Alteromonas sp. ASW11-36]MDM7862008.1 YjgN family protein [Alteromonas sp. ASW11-36]